MNFFFVHAFVMRAASMRSSDMSRSCAKSNDCCLFGCGVPMIEDTSALYLFLDLFRFLYCFGESVRT